MKKKEIEIILTIIIDNLYLNYKNNFCDYKNKTHKLGWFKEQIKTDFHVKLNEYTKINQMKPLKNY